MANSDIQWNTLDEAHEIVDAATLLTSPSTPLKTYKSADDPSIAGDQQIPDSVWTAGYVAPSPYLVNTTRNLQFNQSHFIASPDAPDGTTTYIQTSDGYSWAAMSKAASAMWPYASADYSGLSAVSTYYAGNLVTTPGAGVVKVTANFKAQDMKFWANQNGAAVGSAGAVALDRYFVTDQWGNQYVMHASGQTEQSKVAAAFDAAVLPAGWTKTTRTLSEDLILNPAQGSDGSYHYLVFRDSADNTYHQISWSGGGSLAGQVDGMPIWGGQTGDSLAGDASGARNDLIHAAGGTDQVSGGAGNDTLWGDAGSDAVFGGTGNDLLYGNEDMDRVSGDAGADVIYGNEGADVLDGGDDADTVFGGRNDDTISGGAGNDLILGGEEADSLDGGTGNDTISGGNGTDTIVAGAGNDQITTGNGTDAIIVGDGFGTDTVTDFNGGGGDRLFIEAGINGTDIDSFAEIQAATATVGGSAVITLGSGNTLTLTGVTAAQLRSEWFMFW
jgi:Ca2+-binding RTX toxin-like protein